MFDFGFGEMMIIGAVGLIVLGPERLPVVARKAGEWIGKAQRFVAQVKDDINRESELSELKRIQEEAQNIANDFKNTVEKAATQIESDTTALKKDVEAAGADAQAAFDSVEKSASGVADEAAGAVDEAVKEVSSSATPELDKAVEDAITGKVEVKSNDDIAHFYGWDDLPENAPAPTFNWEEPKTFSKRYRSGPSVDELAREIERLRHELGLREAQLQSDNRRMGVRARSNRPRIYR